MSGPRTTYPEIGLTMPSSNGGDELDQSLRAEQPKTMIFAAAGDNRPSINMLQVPTKGVAMSDLEKPGFATECRDSQRATLSLIPMPLPLKGAAIDEREVPQMESV